MIRMKLHGGCTLSPTQLQKERLKALGIMMERAVRTGEVQEYCFELGYCGTFPLLL